MGGIIELRAQHGDITELADILCEAFDGETDVSKRLKLRFAPAIGTAHSDAERAEVITIDYSDYTDEAFKHVRPLILTIIALAERLAKNAVKIEFRLKSSTGQISASF